MKIDHVGVAVRSIEEALPFYRDSLGLELTHREEVPSQSVRVAFLGAPGQAQVELLEPTGESGAVARFLAAKGPGMHHLAFHAGDLSSAVERLSASGRRALEAPRPGARGHRVCFLHPKDCGGVLVEVVG